VQVRARVVLLLPVVAEGLANLEWFGGAQPRVRVVVLRAAASQRQLELAAGVEIVDELAEEVVERVGVFWLYPSEPFQLALTR